MANTNEIEICVIFLHLVCELNNNLINYALYMQIQGIKLNKIAFPVIDCKNFTLNKFLINSVANSSNIKLL